MSDDLIELEPLLAQYDQAKILVGPLLSLSFGSNFRYFYIAGNGSKVYGSVGLGFVALEDEAQKKRVDIVEKLKSRFRKTVILGSHLEMAEAVHKLWPNEETSRILELAALDAHPTAAVRDPDYEHHSTENMRSGQFLDREAAELIGQDYDVNSVLADSRTLTGDHGLPVLSQGLQSGTPSKLPNVSSSWPFTDDRAVSPQQPQSQRYQEAFPAAVLELQSLIQVDNSPKQPAAGRESLRSTLFRVGLIGSVVVLLVGILVVLNSQQVGHEATPADVQASLSATERENGPSQASNPIVKANKSGAPTEPASVPPLQPSPLVARAQGGAAPISPPQAPARVAAAPIGSVAVSRSQSQPPEPGSVAAKSAPASAPQSPPPRGTVAGTGAAPVAGPQSRPPTVASVAPQTAPVSVPRPQSLSEAPIDADAIGMLIRRAEDLTKNGDFASARLLLRRAANAGSASAALMLGATFDPRIIDELAPLGIEPDVAKARQWYERAAELGSEIAAQRLTKLQMER